VKFRYSIKSQKQSFLKHLKIHTFFDTQLSEDFQSFSSELSVDKLSPSILRKLMNQHAFLKCDQVHIHLIILKPRNELYRGSETKTVSPNGIRSWNTTFNPQLTFRVLSHLLTLISLCLLSLSCNLLSLLCCLSLYLLILCCYSLTLQRCFYVLLLQVSSYLLVLQLRF